MAAHIVLHDGATAAGNGQVYTVGPQDATLALQVSGTFEATVAFEATVDGVNWVAVQARNVSDGSLVTSATAPGIWVVPLAGLTAFRAPVSGYTSGAVTVHARSSPAHPAW